MQTKMYFRSAHRLTPYRRFFEITPKRYIVLIALIEDKGRLRPQQSRNEKNEDCTSVPFILYHRLK